MEDSWANPESGTDLVVGIVAENIRKAREAAGYGRLMQGKFAKAVGLAQARLSGIESSEGIPEGVTLLKIAKGAHVPIDTLLAGVDPEYDEFVARHVQFTPPTRAKSAQMMSNRESVKHPSLPTQHTSDEDTRTHGDNASTTRNRDDETEAVPANVVVVDSGSSALLETLLRIEAQLSTLGDIPRLVEELKHISDAVDERAANFFMAAPDQQCTTAAVIKPARGTGVSGQDQRQARSKDRRKRVR